MACIEGQFDVVELMIINQFKAFSINLNAQHVNGMTPFDLALSTVIRYSRVLNGRRIFLVFPWYMIVLVDLTSSLVENHFGGTFR